MKKKIELLLLVSIIVSSIVISSVLKNAFEVSQLTYDYEAYQRFGLIEFGLFVLFGIELGLYKSITNLTGPGKLILKKTELVISLVLLIVSSSFALNFMFVYRVLIKWSLTSEIFIILLQITAGLVLVSSIRKTGEHSSI